MKPDTKSTLISLLASTTEPRWSISAIARAAGIPWWAVRRYVREPAAADADAARAAERKQQIQNIVSILKGNEK